MQISSRDVLVLDSESEAWSTCLESPAVSPGRGPEWALLAHGRVLLSLSLFLAIFLSLYLCNYMCECDCGCDSSESPRMEPQALVHGSLILFELGSADYVGR